MAYVEDPKWRQYETPNVSSGSGHGSTDKDAPTKQVGFVPPRPKVFVPSVNRKREN